MKTLHLVLKKKWFDMIASGEKKEEYRAYYDYWIKRLAVKHEGNIGGDFMDEHKCIAYTFKKWDTVTFSHGYQKDAPRVELEFKGIEIGCGKSEWGGGPQTFIIKLGKILTARP